MAKSRIMQTMPHNSPGTLVFWRRKSQQNSNRVIPNGGAKCRWGGLNAGAVAENWQLPTWSIINLAQSQVCHTEHPRYLFTARHAGLSATGRPCLLPSTCCRTELLEMSGIGCYRWFPLPSSNQQCWSTAGNSEHWLQPIKAAHSPPSSFIDPCYNVLVIINRFPVLVPFH